jgi:DNA repair exonuclease SbcCD ATPase subunit
MGADDFDSLVEVRSAATTTAVESLNQRLDQLTQDILVERGWVLQRKSLEADLKQATPELRRLDAARRQITTAGGKERADYYSRLGAAITERETSLQRLARREQDLKKLNAEIRRYQLDTFAYLRTSLEQDFAGLGLTSDEWRAFTPKFSGDPVSIVAAKQSANLADIQAVRAGAGTRPTQSDAPEVLASCLLDALKVDHRALGEQLGVDKRNMQRLEQLNKAYETQATKLARIRERLARADEAPTRLQNILSERGGLYQQFFELVTERCDILTDLYSPLADKLADAPTSARKLTLRVVRQVDLGAWAGAGEALLDLRKKGKFQGKGSLAEAARAVLLAPWESGSAEAVAEAMEAFRKDNDESLLNQSVVERGTDEYQQWVVDLGRWLYSTDHIRVHYSIEYDGVAITQLSPGTRGIVLLLLYLALDLEDTRPLIIDQPEENLDPKSVFAELVPLFREARTRRQVIIVTHNANLVVNTDVDQVIVASCIKHGHGEPPEFAYVSGGLESSVIRNEVCEILEGGAAAFKQRAIRLRVEI